MAKQLSMVEHTKKTRSLIQSLKNKMYKKTTEVNNFINSILFE